MGKENKVPAIRFEGFSGEWEAKCLGDIGSLKNGMNFGKEAMGHGYPFINLQDVFGKNEVNNSNLGLAFSTLNQRKEYSLNAGDVLFIRSSVKPEGVGEAAVISKSLENTTYSGFIIRFRPNIEMNINFNRFVYSTINSRKQILASSTSSANSNINQEALQRIQLYLPYKQEQTKIGKYFQQLDTLIAQHQQKHDKLLNLKKSLLEKMFPKQGATEPDIRFKGFSGAWEEKALGDDVADIIGGGTPSTNITEYWDGDIDWYSPTEIGNQVFANGSVKKITKLGLEKSSATVLPANNTVLFTSRAGIGYMAILKKDGSTNQGFQSFVVKNGYDTYFIYSAGNLIKKYALKHASGSTFLEISGKQLSQMEIKTPCLDEQTKIGTLFKNLDSLLNQHQTQLKKLENIKQACLAKMFV